MKKIILSILLGLIFFSGQCFAAEDYPICTKDENHFVTDFNLSATAFKAFKFGTPNFLPMENNPDESHLYAVDTDPETLYTTAYVITNKDNLVNRILLMTDNLENAKKFFKPALLAVDLTEKEIVVSPVFKKTETVKSVWCKATNRYVNISTGIVEGNGKIYYVLILASKG